VADIFPHESSVIRLAVAVLLDQHDDCAIAGHRYRSEEPMAKIDANHDDITSTSTTSLPVA
jgi:hypothetical protein